MEQLQKIEIANICEELYKYCIEQIPQIERDELIWVLNGSTLCNMLYNVEVIDDEYVSEKFKMACYEFIRQPKGDMDITYKEDRPYKFDLDAKQIRNFQNISEEVRTYNFVDSNSILNEIDYSQLCKMKTKSGFTFFAKKPQYIFIYKFREFLITCSQEILNCDVEKINIKKKNILRDINNLYNIAICYCGKEKLLELFNILPSISNYLHNLYVEDKIMYKKLVDFGMNIISKVADVNELKKDNFIFK